MSKQAKLNDDRVERRFVPIEDCELRVSPSEDGGPGRTEGYVALYDRWSPVYNEGTPYAFRERIAPGFFAEAIARDDIRHLMNHDPNRVLGRNRAGTVTYRDDERGLWHEGTLPDTTFARDLAASMGRGDITGASFSFRLPKDGSGSEVRRGDDGVMERTLKRAEKVLDSSIVTYPFYTEAAVAVREVRSAVEAETPAEVVRAEVVPAFDVECARASLSLGLPVGDERRGITVLTRSEPTHAHVRRVVFGQPWALKFDYLEILVDVVARRVRGERLSKAEVRARIEGRAAPPRETAMGGSGVAIIPLTGLILHRAALFEDVSGPQGTSVEEFMANLRAAQADPEVGAIVIDGDSPGGSVLGVEEAATEIRAMRGGKPMSFVTNGMAASACYHLAAQFDEIVVGPSMEVGSVGVYAMHVDWSKALEAEGLAVTYVQAGKYKTELAPEKPLTDEAQQYLQEMVDAHYATFVKNVAKGRGTTVSDVRKNYGEGRMVMAADAVQRGMADRLGTLRETVDRLRKQIGG